MLKPNGRVPAAIGQFLPNALAGAAIRRKADSRIRPVD
jgi:hypothetical protein